MPIQSAVVSSITAHTGGRNRARFKYTLNDGREFFYGPVDVSGDSDAAEKLTAHSEIALSSLQRMDASEAVSKNIKTEHKEATSAIVQYWWLKEAYSQDEHYIAYSMIKDLAPALLSLGYTNEQYAAAFGSTVEDVERIRNYWDFLSQNSEIFEQYIQLGEVR